MAVAIIVACMHLRSVGSSYRLSSNIQRQYIRQQYIRRLAWWCWCVGVSNAGSGLDAAVATMATIGADVDAIMSANPALVLIRMLVLV